MTRAIYYWQVIPEGILKDLLHEAGKTAPTKKEWDEKHIRGGGAGGAPKSGCSQGLFPQGQLQPPPASLQDSSKTSRRKAMWEHSEKKIAHKLGREVAPEINPVGTVILDFLASRTIFYFFLKLFRGTQYDKMHETRIFIANCYPGRASESQRSCSFTLKTQVCSLLGTIRHLHWRPRMETIGPYVLYIL